MENRPTPGRNGGNHYFALCNHSGMNRRHVEFQRVRRIVYSNRGMPFDHHGFLGLQTLHASRLEMSRLGALSGFHTLSRHGLYVNRAPKPDLIQRNDSVHPNISHVAYD